MRNVRFHLLRTCVLTRRNQRVFSNFSKMDSSSSSDLDSDLGYSSGDDSSLDARSQSRRSRKRITRIHLKSRRKKTRSIDDAMEEESKSVGDEHTGLSPRMTRMDLVLPSKMWSSDVFFLEDGIETFSVDRSDPRALSVGEIYHELERRLQQAAISANLPLDSPTVKALKKKIILRAAEIELKITESVGGAGTAGYRNAVFQAVRWIQNASEAELRAFLDGQSPFPETLRTTDGSLIPNRMIMDAL